MKVSLCEVESVNKLVLVKNTHGRLVRFLQRNNLYDSCLNFTGSSIQVHQIVQARVWKLERSCPAGAWITQEPQGSCPASHSEKKHRLSQAGNARRVSLWSCFLSSLFLQTILWSPGQRGLVVLKARRRLQDDEDDDGDSGSLSHGPNIQQNL